MPRIGFIGNAAFRRGDRFERDALWRRDRALWRRLPACGSQDGCATNGITRRLISGRIQNRAVLDLRSQEPTAPSFFLRVFVPLCEPFPRQRVPPRAASSRAARADCLFSQRAHTKAQRHEGSFSRKPDHLSNAMKHRGLSLSRSFSRGSAVFHNLLAHASHEVSPALRSCPPAHGRLRR
jgi:hypothetical protein